MAESVRYQGRRRIYKGVGGRVLLGSGVDMSGNSGRSGGSIDLNFGGRILIVQVELGGWVAKSLLFSVACEVYIPG